MSVKVIQVTKRQFFVFLAIFSAVMFFIGLATDEQSFVLAYKPIVALSLALALDYHSIYAKLVAIALVFCSVGDLLLELNLFIYGLAAFLVAHIFLIFAFLVRSKRKSLGALVIIIIFASAIFAFLYRYLGQMRIAVAVYILVISMMTWRAYAQISYNQRAKWAFVGALFFMISDSLIAIDRFYIPVQNSKWFIMILYWLALGFIFYSANEKLSDAE